MKIIAVILLALSLVACTTTPKPAQDAAPGPAYMLEPQEKINEAIQYVREGLPFTVVIDPYGAIYDRPVMSGELQHLKEHFLLPLARSRYAAKIQRVQIDASGLEWSKWTCIIDLEDSTGPISITHWTGLYDGRGNDDPDGYVKARQYVLATLDNIGRRIGWSHE